MTPEQFEAFINWLAVAMIVWGIAGIIRYRKHTPP